MRTLRLLVTVLSALLLAVSLPLCACAQTGTYTFTELGVLNPARPYIKLGSINNAGQIAGSSIYPDGNIRAFLITPTTIAGQQVWYTDTNNDGVNDLMSVLPLGNKYHWSVGRSVN